jgi:hypothetical protein
MRNIDKVELKCALDAILTKNREMYRAAWQESTSDELRKQYSSWCRAKEEEIASTLEDFAIYTERVSLGGLTPQVLIEGKSMYLTKLFY